MFNDPKIAEHWKEQLFVLSYVLTTAAIGRISRFFVPFLVLCRLFNRSAHSYWGE